MSRSVFQLACCSAQVVKNTECPCVSPWASSGSGWFFALTVVSSVLHKQYRPYRMCDYRMKQRVLMIGMAQREVVKIIRLLVRFSWSSDVWRACRSDSTSHVCSDAITRSCTSFSWCVSNGGMSFSCCNSKSMTTVMLSGRWSVGTFTFVCVVPCSLGNIWNSSEVMKHLVALRSNPAPVSDNVRSTWLWLLMHRSVIWYCFGKW